MGATLQRSRPTLRARLDTATVAQTSKSAVSRVSKPACHCGDHTLPTWKSAIQQVWKPALQYARNPPSVIVSRCAGPLLALATVTFLLGHLREASAQLAITEVMPWAATNVASRNRPAHSDYWEITNFGTNAIDLTHYKFCDGERKFPEDAASFSEFTCDGLPCGSLVIGPKKSIICVRDDRISEAQQFRDWWGDTNLPEGLRIVFYSGFGLDERLDAVQFGDPAGNLVDQVRWDASLMDPPQETIQPGLSFEYETDCGRFVQSGFGPNCHRQMAVLANDIGSPGRAGDPVPLRIREQPAGQTVDAGNSASLCICVCGLPKPRYRWLLNGAELNDDGNVQGSSSSGLHSAILKIQHVDLAHAGEYTVVLDNGLQRATSAVATLTVRTDLKPPVIMTPLSDVTLTTDQQLSLEVAVGGYPRPAYQWYKDGDRLEEQTNNALVVTAVSWTNAGEYCVVAENSVGSTTACARVTVTRRPRLMITEGMSFPASSGGGEDWWELTNVDTNTVNLRGYRWDDEYATNLGAAVVIGCAIPRPLPCPCEEQARECHDVFIRPGESIVFVEGLTRDAFFAWWGAENLPRDLQVITYYANGFDQDSDMLRLWDATASPGSEEIDYIDKISFATGDEGVSRRFDFSAECSNRVYGVLSIEEQCGAFRAANGFDIGSPGWTPWTQAQIIGIAYEQAGIRLTWKAPPGTSTVVEYTASDINNSQWTTLGAFPGPEATRSTVDTSAVRTGTRFYRVLTTANCAPPLCVQ